MMSRVLVRALVLVWVPALAAARLLHPPLERPYTVAATKHPIINTENFTVAPDLVASTSKGWSRTAADRSTAVRPPSAAADSSSADSIQLLAASLWPHVSGLHTPQGCPIWMSDYAAFHARQRGQPGARYLIHNVRHGNSGLGDRVRGMLFAARLAVATKRVILFSWRNDPAEPEAYLIPASSIDWTLKGTGYFSSDDPVQNPTNITLDSSLELDMYNWLNGQHKTLEKVKQGFLQSRADVQYITLHTNERAEANCMGCPRIDKPMRKQDTAGSSSAGLTNSAACLFRLLFKPSRQLEEAASDQLLQLFGPISLAPNFQCTATHLRLGGLGHEGALNKDRGTGKGELTDVIAALTCAQRLGQDAGLDTGQSPVLLITDNHMLRKFVLSGGLAHAVAPNFFPSHMARLDDQEKAGPAAMATFIDLLLLARAQCLVASDSGFSEAAWMLGGGKSCLGRLQDRQGGGCGMQDVLRSATQRLAGKPEA